MIRRDCLKAMFAGGAALGAASGLSAAATQPIVLEVDLAVDPALPAGIGHLALLDIPGRWGKFDAFGRGSVRVNGGSGLRQQLAEAAAGR